MMPYLLGYYFACQLFLLIFFIHGHVNNDLDLDGETIFLVIAFVIFSPVGVLVLFGVIIGINLQERKRRTCQRIMTQWEAKAKEGVNDTWDWYHNSSKAELRANRLRETVGLLTDDELDKLVTVGKSTYELDRFIRDAVMDEIIHREIRKA